MNLSGKLSTIVVDEEQTEDQYVHYCEIHSAKFGDLSLIYHTFKLNEKDIGLDSDSILTDRGGREISSVEGIVLRGRTPNILITNHTFKEIHKSLMFNYKDFWNVSEFTCPYSSVSFELGFNQPNETSLQFIHHNPYILEAPKNSLCAKWIRVKNILEFHDCKLISATFSPDGNKMAVHFIEKGKISLTSCVIYCNLSESSTPARPIFKGDQGLNLCENSYLNLSSAIFSPDSQSDFSR